MQTLASWEKRKENNEYKILFFALPQDKKICKTIHN